MDFLDLLFPDLKGYFLLIWTLPDKRSAWFRDTRSAYSYAERLQNKDVYFGCGLLKRNLGTRSRGTINDVVAIPGIWLDIDLKGPGHTKPDLPENIDEVLEVLDKFEKPSIIVNSGRGLHVYWLFDKLLEITDENRDKAKDLIHSWQKRIRREFKSRGWSLDSTHDFTRVLRLPGTFNMKTGKNVPVKIIYSSEVKYSVQQLENALRITAQDKLPIPADGTLRITAQDKLPIPADDTLRITAQDKLSIPANDTLRIPAQDKLPIPANDTLRIPAQDKLPIPADDMLRITAQDKLLIPADDIEPIPLDRFNALLENNKDFNKTWFHKRCFHDQSQSSYDLSLATFAVQAEWADGEIGSLLLQNRLLFFPDSFKKHDMNDYLKRTIKKAREGYEMESTKKFEEERIRENVNQIKAGNKNEDILKRVSELLGIEVTNFIKFTCDPPSYKLVTKKGEVNIAETRSLLNQAIFREKVLESTNVLVNKLRKKKDYDPWEEVVQGLINSREEVDLGEENHETGQLRSWLVDYLDDNPAIDFFSEDALDSNPRIKDNRIYFFIKDFREWLFKVERISITSQKLGVIFVTAGGGHARIKPKAKTLHTCWLPQEFFEF